MVKLFLFPDMLVLEVETYITIFGLMFNLLTVLSLTLLLQSKPAWSLDNNELHCKQQHLLFRRLCWLEDESEQVVDPTDLKFNYAATILFSRDIYLILDTKKFHYWIIIEKYFDSIIEKKL